MKKNLLFTSLALSFSLIFPALTLNQAHAAGNVTYIKATKKANYLNPSILSNFSLNSVYSNLVAEKQFQTIFSDYAYMAEKFHYKHIDIQKDKDFAKKTLDFYLKALDPYYIFFNKEDKNLFVNLYTSGSKPKITNNLDVAFKIYATYAKRATAFNKALVSRVLDMKSEPNLDTNITITSINFNTEYQSESDFDQVVNNEIIRRIINYKIDRNLTDWDKIRELIIRESLHTQKTINNYNATKVFSTFASQGLSLALDSHSSYYPPEDQNQFTDALSSSFYGIGVGIKYSPEGLFTFDSIIDGGPVSRQGGVEPNDVLEAVSQDGRKFVDTDDLDMDQIIKLIKGKKGTPVYLKLLSTDGRLKIVKIIRGKVINETNTVKFSTFKENGKEYGVASFGSFYKNLDNDLRKALIKHPNIEGLIIDLRYNGGGFVNEVLGISDIFLDTFSPVFQTTPSDSRVSGSPRQAVPTSSDYLFKFKKPLIVLVGGSSASASEIFSAAIQDYKRGLVIGSTTYGKGTVQTPFEMSPFFNEGLIKLTIEKFLRVNGKSTQFLGVTPDIPLQSKFNSNVPGASERSSINPLSYIFLSPARYSPFSSYVSSDIIKSVANVKNTYTSKYPIYKKYEQFKETTYNRMGEKEYKLNYSYQKDRINSSQNLSLYLYNQYASIIGYPKASNYKEISNLKAKDNKFDPDLDLAKHMLVKYSSLIHK